MRQRSKWQRSKVMAMLYNLGGVTTMFGIKINRLAAIITFVLMLFSPTPGQNSESQNTIEQKIKELERARFNAYLKLDVAALDRLMSDDYTSIYANGQIVAKSTEIQGMKTVSAGMLSSVSANIDQLSVHAYGKVAILTGRLTVKGKLVWSQKDIDVNSSFRYTA